MTELSPEVARARQRPGMYIGDTGTYGLSHLVYFLLDAAVAEARAGTLRRLSLSLEEDGSVELIDDGRPVPPEDLPDLLTHLRPLQEPDRYEPLRFETFCVFALAEHFELESWDEARRWRVRGEAGVLRELPSPEPLQSPRSPKPRGTRIRFRPDRTLFDPGATLDPHRLHLRCRELAGLTPGLRIDFRSPRLMEQIHCPRGLADLVDALTLPLLPNLHPPVVAEAQWEGLRVRCALQWTRSPDCQLWSFANTVRTRLGGHHLEGALDALAQAIAQVGQYEKPERDARLLLGLTLVVAVDGPRSRLTFSGPTKDLLSIEGLREGTASVLAPLLEQSLRALETQYEKPFH